MFYVQYATGFWKCKRENGEGRTANGWSGVSVGWHTPPQRAECAALGMEGQRGGRALLRGPALQSWTVSRIVNPPYNCWSVIQLRRRPTGGGTFRRMCGADAFGGLGERYL